jgi:hypothetical protein
MWFKTRVGLYNLGEPLEIRVFQPEAGHWLLMAQLRNGPEGKGRSLLGKIDMSGPWFYLAKFRDHPGVQADIGHALERIATAAQSGAPVCDLTQVGHPDAWEDSWVQVAWPRQP